MCCPASLSTGYYFIFSGENSIHDEISETYFNSEVPLVTCPVCKGNNTGKIGGNTYYCASCLLEFTEHDGKVNIYYIDPEGTAIPLKNTDMAQQLVGVLQNDDELLSWEEIRPR